MILAVPLIEGNSIKCCGFVDANKLVCDGFTNSVSFLICQNEASYFVVWNDSSISCWCIHCMKDRPTFHGKGIAVTRQEAHDLLMVFQIMNE